MLVRMNWHNKIYPKHGGFEERPNEWETRHNHRFRHFLLFLQLLLAMLLLLLLLMKTIQRRIIYHSSNEREEEQANHALAHTNAQLCGYTYAYTAAATSTALHFHRYTHIQRTVAIAHLLYTFR